MSNVYYGKKFLKLFYAYVSLSWYSWGLAFEFILHSNFNGFSIETQVGPVRAGLDAVAKHMDDF